MDTNNYQEIMDHFSVWYMPADSIDRATDFFSTQEILDAITQINPTLEVNLKQIYAIMVSFGYRYAPDPNQLSFNLKWMLIRKF